MRYLIYLAAKKERIYTIQEKIHNILKKNYSTTSQMENNHLQFYSDIDKGKIFDTKLKSYQFNKQAGLWNSGVIGMNTNVPISWIEEIYELANTLYAQYKYRVSEQFAFSYVLGTHCNIKTAEDTIFHYWFLKDTMQILWDYFYDEVHTPEKNTFENLRFTILSKFYHTNDASIVRDIILDHPKDSLIHYILQSSLEIGKFNSKRRD